MAEGLSDEAARDYEALQQRLRDALLHEESDAKVAEVFKAEARAWGETLRNYSEDLPDWFLKGPNPEKRIPRICWSREFLRTDPGKTITKVRCPTLMLYGEKDMQVPASENLSRVESLIKSHAMDNVVIKELPGLNHLLQSCQVGAISRYEKIEETISPRALQCICDWIQGLSLKGCGGMNTAKKD